MDLLGKLDQPVLGKLLSLSLPLFLELEPLLLALLLVLVLVLLPLLLVVLVKTKLLSQLEKLQVLPLLMVDKLDQRRLLTLLH
jgi:hypothetical protein